MTRAADYNANTTLTKTMELTTQSIMAIGVLVTLLVLRRRRTGKDAETRLAQNALLMNLDMGRTPRA
jgi:hypothetical protein